MAGHPHSERLHVTERFQRTISDTWNFKSRSTTPKQ